MARPSRTARPFAFALALSLAGLWLWVCAPSQAAPPSDVPQRRTSAVGAQRGSATAQGPQGAPFTRRLGGVDYLGTLVLLGVYYTIELGLDEPTGADWTKPLPVLDRAARALFVRRSRAARDRSEFWSDRMWIASTVYPVAASLVAPALRGWSFGDIWQMQVMNVQTYGLASILTRLPHKLIGRLRPNSIGCRDDPDYSPHCRTDAINLSFFGGHTAISMTGAGLACAHHLEGHLFGIPWLDAAGCGGALAAASVVFVARLQADKHWLSDQLVSVVVGLGVGYGLPTLLYYRSIFANTADDAAGEGGHRRASFRSTLLPLAGPDRVGAAWAGYF